MSMKILRFTLIAGLSISLVSKTIALDEIRNNVLYKEEVKSSREASYLLKTGEEDILSLQLTKEEWEIVTKEVISDLRKMIKAKLNKQPFPEISKKPIKGIRAILANNVDTQAIARGILEMYGDSLQTKSMETYLLSETFVRDVLKNIEADMVVQDRKRS